MHKNWDVLLKIQSEEIEEGLSDTYHHRYEPTPYPVLERLLDSGLLNHSTHFIDIGCGKGRIPIFFAQTLGIQTTGVDFDKNLIIQANQNRLKVACKHQIRFIHQKAEDHLFTSEDAIYFFNPFTLNIFQSVLSHIISSWYESPRTIRLFFYYIDDEILAYMMSIHEFIFYDEIPCEDLFANEDHRENIMVFETISFMEL